MNADGSGQMNLTTPPSTVLNLYPDWGAFATEDADGDGIADTEDDCPDSDLSTTVVIDGCNSHAQNDLFPDGCTISDLVTNCLEDSSNRIRALLCVTRLTKDLRRAGAISLHETIGILSCTVQALFP
jgi:hypothetical protein